ncbi:hypothetical protein BU583_12045 [Staphylococcus agnetis]|uniref:hypothetical protein n=1 Tax=Staphylococcus agnetis TaxID=985762 RepID=UPI000D1A060F|nr:hypothetical protein [Staphylococcus agnetis]PTH60924.1 hypothetical protein BU583_12045 [Staphylococcus agnetis]
MIYLFFLIMIVTIGVTALIFNCFYKKYKRVAYDRHKVKISELYQWHEDMKQLKKKEQVDIVIEALEKYEQGRMKWSD